MDLKQFYFYIAIAEECNLSRAADRLFVSQPSLSRFLTNLEKSLGVSLFERMRNNSLVITNEGKQFLEYCRLVIFEYDNLVQHISGNIDDSRQVFCGVTSDRSTVLMAKTLPAFSKLHPNIKITLLQFPAEKLIALLRSGEIDVAWCAYIDTAPDLNYAHLVRHRVDLAVPPNHPLSIYGSNPASDSACSISLNDLSKEPFVLLNNTTVLRKLLQAHFERNNFSPHVKIEVATSSSALSLVESGVAVGLLPRSISSDKVKFLQLNPPLYYNTGLIYRKERYLPAWKKDFIRLCQEAFTESATETDFIEN